MAGLPQNEDLQQEDLQRHLWLFTIHPHRGQHQPPGRRVQGVPDHQGQGRNRPDRQGPIVDPSESL